MRGCPISPNVSKQRFSPKGWTVVSLLLGTAGIFLLLPVVTNGNPGGGKSFRMVLTAEPPTLDWNLATDGVSFLVITNLMEGLTEYDRDLRPQPAVAEKWDVSADGMTYTFYLREGVRWTDGKPVTAEDFEYSWKRLLAPETGAEYAYFLYDVVNAYDYNTGRIRDASKVGVKALSPGVLQVRLNKPVVYFPSITTFMVTFPVRRDRIEKYGNRWTEPENLVTDGPFQLSEWRHEYKLSLKANPYYYGKKPSFDEVSLFVVNEPATALTLYETGDIDMASLPPEAMATYSHSPEYRKVPLLRGYYYGFNTGKAPFDDTRVRRAFSMAIDREEIPRVLRGGEIPTASWIPKGMFGYNPSIGLPFDPSRARRLLAEAGYPSGSDFPETEAAFDTGPLHTLIAENLQAQWKRNLGVKVRLENQEWKVYLRRLKTDTPPLFRLGWGADYPDPDNFMVLFTTGSGNNNTHWGNRRYDALVARAAADADPESRMKLYDEAQRILVERDVAIMPLFISVQNVLIKSGLRGLDPNPLELLYLKRARWEGSGAP